MLYYELELKSNNKYLLEEFRGFGVIYVIVWFGMVGALAVFLILVFKEYLKVKSVYVFVFVVMFVYVC